MDNREISEVLNEIGMLLELKGENPFKIRAYYNASRIIDSLQENVRELIEQDRLQEVDGIGKALKEKLIELVKTGKLQYYENLKKCFPKELFDILKIPGLGPKKVKELYEKLHIKNLAELEYACFENRLIQLKGFGEKTQNKILEGIEHIKKIRGKHLLSTALDYGDSIVKQLKNLPEIDEISLGGSIRRKKEIIKDIDIIASCDEEHREKVMNYFSHFEEVERIIAKGNSLASVLLKAGIQVDLRLVQRDQYIYALHHFTGSKEHNTAIRHRAKKMDLKVNEYGIFHDEKRISVKDEGEFYQVLGLQYIPPELRENSGEIEAAEKNQIPKLIEKRNIKGMLHVHSYYSDGINSIEEIVKAAMKRGYQYIGISDHSRSAYYARGLKEEDVLQQHKEMEGLRNKYPEIIILKGIESEILADGSLDYDQEILASFDYVIGAVHSHFSMDKTRMTERMIKAIENKYLNILAHPSGRLLLSREAYEMDFIAVIDCCAENGVAVEINSHPQRLDIDWRMCRYAKEKGVKFVIEPDAHRIEGMDDIFYGVCIARKGWLEAKDVLNTYDIGDLLNYFKKDS